MKVLLKPAELAYRLATRVRRTLYGSGVREPLRLPRPVISIGNIAFGGSGKTPLVIAIAEELTQRGHGVAILSRGYRRHGGDPYAIVTGSDPDRFGDEPVVIAGSVPAASVIVGVDRFAAGMHFLEHGECDVFLLDDGFQHLRLYRDLDVVIDDAEATLLRESRSALAHADVVVFRDGDPGPEGFQLAIRPQSLVIDGQPWPLARLGSSKVLAFCGLANNERFFQSCREAGALLVGSRSFPDHHRYRDRDLDSLMEEAKQRGADVLLTTEKDAVKIRRPGFAFLRVRAEVAPRHPFFERLLEVLRR